MSSLEDAAAAAASTPVPVLEDRLQPLVLRARELGFVTLWVIPPPRAAG